MELLTSSFLAALLHCHLLVRPGLDGLHEPRFWADGTGGSVPASRPGRTPRPQLPGTFSVSFCLFLYFSIQGLPATLDWWDLCKSSWQHFPSFTRLSFSVLDAFDSCLGFIGLINLISAVSSMLAEIIPDNVLLIPVIAE